MLVKRPLSQSLWTSPNVLETANISSSKLEARRSLQVNQRESLAPAVTHSSDSASNRNQSFDWQCSETKLALRVVTRWNEIDTIVPEWNRLTGRALEPSPSSESWMLVPSLRYICKDPNVKVVLMYRQKSPSEPSLIAVFPVQVHARFKGLPIRLLSIWNHPYSLFPAPVVDREFAHDSLRALLNWNRSNFGSRSLLMLPELRSGSAFFEILADIIRKDDLQSYVTNMHTRAFFRPRYGAQEYLDSIGTAHHQKEFRRQERHLSELGELTYVEYQPSDDLTQWVGDFISLEMTGWKGKEGTAFGCNEEHSAWLHSVVAEAQQRKELMFLALKLMGKPIAMKLNFLAPPGGYTFKIAFDESYSKYSPGALLELENIRRLHNRPNIRWMDSLAVAGHSLMNRVWIDQEAVMTTLVAPRRSVGELIVSLLPLLTLIKRWLPHKSSGKLNDPRQSRGFIG